MDSMPLAQVRPSAGDDIVTRRRLARHSQAIADRRLTIVQAPAGFGKSTVLRHWRDALNAEGHTTAWLSLDRYMSDIVGLIIAAVREADPDLKSELSQLLAQDEFVTTDLELAGLVAAIGRLGRRVVILIDDGHFLAKGELRVLERLVDRLPLNANIVMASREMPDLPLARLRAHGELFELTMNELRFTVDEARQLFLAQQHITLSDEEVTGLVERTEGWAAGLRLAGLVMSGGASGAKLVGAVSGRKSVIADFFSEDVFGSQPADIQQFLLRTCLLERFSADFCNAVTGRDDGREMIGRIEASGLFLIRLDDENRWFRYHGLFADFLSRRLSDIDPALVAAVHRDASRWLYKNDLYMEALDHAVSSGDQLWLAEMLEEIVEELIYRGKLTSVVALAEGIDKRILNRCPRIMLAIAWLRMRNLRLDESRTALNIAASRIDEMEKEGVDAEQMKVLRLLLRHREMMFAAASDDFAAAEEKATALMREVEYLSPYIVCNLYGQTIRAQSQQFKFQHFERNEARARGVLERSKHKFAFVAQQAIVGITQFQLCRNDAAERALRHGLGQAVDFAGEGSPLAALPALPMAVVHYERNELDQAAELVDRYLPVVRTFGFSDELLCGYLLRPAILAARGAIPAAFAAIEDARSVGLETGLERIVLLADAEKVRMLLATGHVERALEVARLSELTAEGRDLAPRMNANALDEAIARINVRLALCQGEAEQMLPLIQRWKQFCFHRNAARHLIGWNLLQAQALMMAGDGRAALRSLREALVAAAQGQNRRIFLDEGQRVHDLLAEGYGSGLLTKHPADLLASELLGLFESRSRASVVDNPDAMHDDVAIDGKMTGREIEILTCVASGLRNKEIGDRLGLTEGSVKWYMQRIYDKVGTRRRSLAVERARQFGFLG